jgi:hypothetical protein
MINLLFLIIGMMMPTLLGWLVLRLAEGKQTVLHPWERVAWAVVLGSTLMMLVIFTLHILGAVGMTLVGYTIPTIILIAGVAFMLRRVGILNMQGVRLGVTHPQPQWLSILLVLLLVWTAAKLMAGGVLLWNVPTYWDDSFNNWNMRGKVFFETGELSLQYDIGNEQQQSETGVSSYPPTVPMVKAWLSLVRGSWQEPIVNGVHAVWFLALLGALGLRVAVMQGKKRGWWSVYVLASLPLVLIHGMNPYADVFVGAHVFMALVCIYELSKAEEEQRAAWTWLAAVTIGALNFTKNEALLLYTPPLTALLLWIMLRHTHGIRWAYRLKHLAIPMLLIAIIALPWIGFKWANGLTFGNAKSVSDTSFAFNARAAEAIWFSLSKEANVLFLPLFLTMSVILRRSIAWSFPVLPVTLLAFTIVAMQFALFSFVPALATEAIMQTGLARGLVQISAAWVLLAFLVWAPEKKSA